jgi:hypothetical protein
MLPGAPYLSISIGDTKYRLWINADGKPYILKRYHLHSWRICWAEWHKGLPTGSRLTAIREMGFEWRNDNPETLGWHPITRVER